MADIGEGGKTRIILIAGGAAAGITVLYGGLTALALWLFGSEQAAETGGVVAGVTAGLCLVVALLGIYLARKDGGKMHVPELAAVVVAAGAFAVLLFPLIILTFGWLVRWLNGETSAGEEEAEAE